MDYIFDLIRFGTKSEPRYYKCVAKSFLFTTGVRCHRIIKVDGAIEVPAAVKNDREWLESAFKIPVEIR